MPTEEAPKSNYWLCFFFPAFLFVSFLLYICNLVRIAFVTTSNKRTNGFFVLFPPSIFSWCPPTHPPAPTIPGCVAIAPLNLRLACLFVCNTASGGVA